MIIWYFDSDKVSETNTSSINHYSKFVTHFLLVTTIRRFRSSYWVKNIKNIKMEQLTWSLPYCDLLIWPFWDILEPQEAVEKDSFWIQIRFRKPFHPKKIKEKTEKYRVEPVDDRFKPVMTDPSPVFAGYD